MPDERMYPILPCPDLDAAIAFYEALGFTRTYRQLRPNPHAVVSRGELAIHLAGIDGFDPEQSYASVIVVVPDPDALYQAFAAGLRQLYGRLPVSGIPRITRPRKRYGTVAGFSLIDVGGNWLRVSRAGDTEEDAEHADAGLARISRGRGAAGRLEGRRCRRAQDARERSAALPGCAARGSRAALLYRAELAVRLQNETLANARSLAEMRAIELTDDERASVADELDHVGSTGGRAAELTSPPARS